MQPYLVGLVQIAQIASQRVALYSSEFIIDSSRRIGVPGLWILESPYNLIGIVSEFGSIVTIVLLPLSPCSV